MAVSHVHTQKVAFTPAHIQLGCDGVYLAVPLTRTTIGVCSLTDLSYKPLELIGHSKTLTALALGNKSSPKLLVSGATDYIIVWNLQEARQQVQKGEKVRGRVIGTTLGNVQYCSLSPDDSRVAVCTGFEIVILLTQRECKVAVLEGHDGPVTSAEFCPHYSATLVSISEDRTFKVWNLEEMTLVYQSPILTASPFLSIAMSLHQPRVAIGAADGVVRVFDLTDGNGFRCLHQIDVNKVIVKEREEKYNAQFEAKKAGPVTVSSRPTWKQQAEQSPQAVADSGEPLVEAGSSVLALYFTYIPPQDRQLPSASVTRQPFATEKSNIVSDLLSNSPMLLVGTTAGLLKFNERSLDMCSYVDLQEPVKSSKSSTDKKLNAAGSVIFGQGSNDQVWCIIGSPFQNEVHVLRWNKEDVKQKISSHQASHMATDGHVDGEQASGEPARACSSQKQAEIISVLSTVSLLDDSPLRAEMVPKQKENQERRASKDMTSSTSKKGGIPDNQPLTFKTKIKSSGYSSAPRMTMHKPLTNVSKSSAKSNTPKSGGKPAARPTREYPMSSKAPEHLSIKVDVAERPTAVNCVNVSDDGHNIACGLANKSALVFSLPLSQKGSTPYTGHNHVVTDVDWSHCGKRLLTSSDDKTAAVWVKGQTDPVLIFDRTLKNCPDGQAAKKENKTFSKEVRFAQFYFMDRFILLCSGKSMFMYKYCIDTTKNDIQRYLSQSRYKVVREWTMESQQVTSMTAINSFLSYILLCACSNKSIEVFDMNVGHQVRKMTDVHTRPVHAICQNEGSQFVGHPSGAYDLFASAAAGDCIKLWDLRTNRCVRRYEGHLNRVHPCGLSFSPCGRFIATGSEDKCSYIYDMRSGTFLHKLQGQSDVVADVTFHPLHPQLYTGCLDGKVAQYNSR